MKTIHLQCPNCQALMELDAGFAGGVCRCFACGTLMTVPADPNRDSPEMLSRRARPERPNTPGSAPGSAPERAPVRAAGGSAVGFPSSASAGDDAVEPGRQTSERFSGNLAGQPPAKSPPHAPPAAEIEPDDDDPLAMLAAEAARLDEEQTEQTEQTTDSRQPTPPEPPEATKGPDAPEGATGSPDQGVGVESEDLVAEEAGPPPLSEEAIEQLDRSTSGLADLAAHAAASTPAIPEPGEPVIAPEFAPFAEAAAARPQSPRPGSNEQLFVTASGKTIRIADPAKIPTARQRRKLIIRSTTAVTMVGAVAVIIGLMTWAMIALLGSMQDDPNDPNRFFDFNQRNNPFTSSAVEFLQVPIPQRVVISMQIGGPLLADEDWDLVRRQLQQVIDRLPAQTELSLHAWDAQRDERFPADGRPRAWSAEDRQAAGRFVTRLQSFGRRGDPLPAMEQAINAEPGRVILVLAQRLGAEDRPKIRELLAAHPEIPVDLLVLDVDERTFGEFIRERGGRFVAIPSEQLRAWAKAAE